ncbi:MAG: cytochrome c5 family protein [Gammaproteobacteria bacterium]
MSNQDDAVFVRNFSMVLVGLVVVGIMAFILAKIVNRTVQESTDYSPTAAARVAPMGQLNTGDAPVALETAAAAAAPAHGDAPAAAPAEASGDIGQATYDKVCFACHAQGIAGAPKYGDMAAWETRLEKGNEALYHNAVAGFTGPAGMMPPKGGNPALSDDEVKAAVDHMLAAVGGGGGSPAPAASEEAAPAADAAASEEAPAATAEPATEATTASADSGRGKEVYDAACFVCHTPGAAGAPKFGDAAAWVSRIEKGKDTLYHSAINGFMGSAGMMPPKGGRPDFSDDDVKAAVDYMVANGQ